MAAGVPALPLAVLEQDHATILQRPAAGRIVQAQLLALKHPVAL